MTVKGKMMEKNSTAVFMALILFWLLTGAIQLRAAEKAQPLVLFNFDKGFDVSKILSIDAKVNLSQDSTLRIKTGNKKQWPGITLKAPAGKWDLSKYEYVSIDIKNIGTEPVTIYCRVDNPGADGSNNCVTESISLNPNKSEMLTVRLYPTTYQLSEPVELIGMRLAPAQQGKLDASNVTQLLVFVNKPSAEHVFEIDNIRAGGRVKMMNAKTFFPFIDELGQYVHKDWPGKTHSLEELIAHGKVEAGLQARSSKPPASSECKNSKTSGGLLIRRADSSSRTELIASAVQTLHLSPTANTTIATCRKPTHCFQHSTAGEAGHRMATIKTTRRTEPMTSARQISCGSTAGIGSRNSPTLHTDV
jgi:hypothetical protein